MIEIEQRISVYEINDKDVPVGHEVTIGVSAHWSRNSEVVLKVGRQRYTVKASDLKVAIENAQNSGDK